MNELSQYWYTSLCFVSFLCHLILSSLNNTSSMILFPSGLTQSRMFSTQDSFLIFLKRKSTENLIVLRVSSNCYRV